MYNLVLNELEKSLKNYNSDYYNLYTKICFLYDFLNKKIEKNFKLEVLEIFYNLREIEDLGLDIDSYIRDHYKDKLINILFIYAWYKNLQDIYSEQTILQKLEHDYKNSSEYRNFKLNLPKINEIINLESCNFDKFAETFDKTSNNKVDFLVNDFFDFVELEYNAMGQEVEVYNSTKDIIIRICIEGALFYSYDSSNEHILLRRGDTLLVNQFIFNKATFLTEKCKILVFRVKSPFILETLNKKFKKNSTAITTLYRINDFLKDYNSNEKDVILLKILLNIIDYHTKTTSALDSFYALDSEFNEIIKYIDFNIDKGLTVNSLEKKYKLYNKILNDKFKKYLNALPSEYLIEQKLLRAALILKTTDYKISYISDMLSFTSANTFTISFKNKFGVTPLKYRNIK